ncbi:MAG: hypothetical protein OHK0017_06260 [Patescibacteria group bacterium]
MNDSNPKKAVRKNAPRPIKIDIQAFITHAKPTKTKKIIKSPESGMYKFRLTIIPKKTAIKKYIKDLVLFSKN